MKAREKAAGKTAMGVRQIIGAGNNSTSWIVSCQRISQERQRLERERQRLKRERQLLERDREKLDFRITLMRHALEAIANGRKAIYNERFIAGAWLRYDGPWFERGVKIAADGRRAG